MPTTLRIGIIGCGGIARAHVDAYKAAPDVKLTHTYDLIPAAAQKLAADTGATAVNALDDMLGQVDAVSICTPPASHPENLRPFITAKIPALCEKPLAINTADAQTCADLAAQHNAFVMLAFCHRFHPAIIETKRLLASGALGRPVLFRNLFGGYLKLAGNHRADPHVSGGGPLIDHCAHSVDLFRHLVGEPAHVQAIAVNAVQDAAIEDLGLMLLQTADHRAIGEITGSYSLPASGNWVELHCEQASVRASYWNAGFADLALRRAGTKDWVPIDCSAHPDRFRAEINAFLHCVRTQTPPPITLADGLAASRIIDAAYTAARTGQRTAIT